MVVKDIKTNSRTQKIIHCKHEIYRVVPVGDKGLVLMGHYKANEIHITLDKRELKKIIKHLLQE